jgi:hypothetical protein
MPRTIMCAIAEDECLDDVLATGRLLAAAGALRPVFVHVGQSARLAPSPIGFGVGAGAAATASLHEAGRPLVIVPPGSEDIRHAA